MELQDVKTETSTVEQNQYGAPNCQNLHQTLNEFRLANILCDVMIMDDSNQSTPAHSCILAAASPVLKSTVMLKDTNKMLNSQGLTLMIAGISVEVWKLLLEYLYLNTLVIPAVPGLLENVLIAANMLGMKELMQLITNHVESVGIALGPIPESNSLKITLAPTRPVSMETKSVQTTDEIFENLEIQSSEEMLHSDVIKSETNVVIQRLPAALAQDAMVANVVTQESANNLQEIAADESSMMEIGVYSLKCRYCRMEFHRKANLVEHVADWCTQLKKPFLPTDIADVNMEAETSTSTTPIATPGDGRIYKCINPDCGQFFTTSTAMKRHSWNCILGPDTTKPMEQLVELNDGTIIYRDSLEPGQLDEGSIAEPRAYLASDAQTTSVKARMYNCAHCTFNSKRERMASHLAVHHGKRRPFSCRVCGLRYGYYDSLRDHYIGVHTKAQFTCTDCGKVFKRSIMLRRHQLYEHTREGKAMFPCKGCGKKFKSLAHARRHELYHNPMDQRRKYSCDVCDKLFCTRQDLERHHESVHSDVKPYKCSQCPYSTPRKFYLSQHEKKHGIVTGRFMCMTCEKVFVSKPFFEAHLREKNHQGADIMQLAHDTTVTEEQQFSEATLGTQMVTLGVQDGVTVMYALDPNQDVPQGVEQKYTIVSN